MANKKKVLMVCSGNICQSPIAEAVFLDMIRKQNLTDQWEVDSAGLIDYNTGKNPDYRALSVLKEHGIDYNHKARVITMDDFNKFDWIFGMEPENIKKVRSMKPKNSSAKVILLGQYDSECEIISEPYYEKDFYTVYDQCFRNIKGFLAKQKEKRTKDEF